MFLFRCYTWEWWYDKYILCLHWWIYKIVCSLTAIGVSWNLFYAAFHMHWMQVRLISVDCQSPCHELLLLKIYEYKISMLERAVALVGVLSLVCDIYKLFQSFVCRICWSVSDTYSHVKCGCIGCQKEWFISYNINFQYNHQSGVCIEERRYVVAGDFSRWQSRVVFRNLILVQAMI